MSRITLRLPTQDDIISIENALAEEWEPDFPFLHYFETLADRSVDKYIQILPNFPVRQFLPDGHVPCTFLFAFDENNKIVGRVSIRHELNEFLSKVGGHVGYGVVPSERNKGYATQMLKYSLDFIRTNLPTLKEVLVTCDDDNVGSIKTIEKNCGVLVDPYFEEGMRIVKRRYYIELIPK